MCPVKMRSWIIGSLVVCLAVTASSHTLVASDVEFHLYTRDNPTLSHPLLPTAASIMGSALSLTRKTVFTIHNSGEGAGGNFNAFVIPELLNREDINLIAIDWSPGSSVYTLGLANAPTAGQFIANFINLLINSFNYNPNLIHIVGVGLGGHIAGIAARNTAGTIPRITALDPSFHGWTHNSNILGPDAATVVEVIHTSTDGFDWPLGTHDFYPNGGSSQTGCGIVVSCSHTYSYVFYAESIQAEVNGGNKFVGRSCESYEQAVNQQERCTGDDTAVFGGTEDQTAPPGIYHFNTNFNQPFAQGLVD